MYRGYPNFMCVDVNMDGGCILLVCENFVTSLCSYRQRGKDLMLMMMLIGAGLSKCRNSIIARIAQKILMELTKLYKLKF